MKILHITGLMLAILVLAACKKDNYDAPESTLTGRVVFEGQPLGVRSNGVQLELWQHGYAFFSKIPVFVDQDGSFSALLFDGDYKLVRLRGNGPWVDNTDSIDVSVRGNTTVDVPVDPFFVFTNQSYQRNGSSVTATFSIRRVNTSRNLEFVKLYLGQTVLVDDNINAASIQRGAGDITDISQPITLTVNIPAALAAKGYVYARVGVKTEGVPELLYTQVEKITLN